MSEPDRRPVTWVGDKGSISQTEKQMRFFKTRLSHWTVENTRDFPWRRTVDPYKICVAEIMLHQTGANKVAPIYDKFVKRYPTVEILSRAKAKTLQRIIYPLGFLYRAERLKEIAIAVVNKHGGQMPRDKHNLLSLPGVGEYTASAVMCFAYGEQIPIIDVNVVRLYSRYFGLARKLPSSAPDNRIKEIAIMALPRKKAREYNYAVLDFAAMVCRHYNPDCSNCPLKTKCKYNPDNVFR